MRQRREVPTVRMVRTAQRHRAESSARPAKPRGVRPPCRPPRCCSRVRTQRAEPASAKRTPIRFPARRATFAPPDRIPPPSNSRSAAQRPFPPRSNAPLPLQTPIRCRRNGRCTSKAHFPRRRNDLYSCRTPFDRGITSLLRAKHRSNALNPCNSRPNVAFQPQNDPALRQRPPSNGPARRR